jgi:hypothetical protein
VTDHTRRFGRPHLSWGQNDPGVGLDVVVSEHKLDQYVSKDYDRSAKILPATTDLQVASSSLIHLRNGDNDKPCLVVRITTFACGGISVAVGMHHCLADAMSLTTFVDDWATVHRALLAGKVPNLPHRPFEPLRLDHYAAGNIDAAQENVFHRESALALPQIRLDFWASSKDKPSMMSTPCHPHPAVESLDIAQGRPRGARVPWTTWSATKKVLDRSVEFSPTDVHEIWVKSGGELESSHSRLDALLAHLWRCIVKARSLPENCDIYLDMTLGLRTRFDPPLPSTFIGSPIQNFTTSATSQSLLSRPLQFAAQSIRSTIAAVDSDNLSKLLHHDAYALDPIREWNAFMGDQHLMVTSWLGTNAYRIDFGGGEPVEVVANMWPIDGLMVLMDRPCTKEKWYDSGATVRIFLEEETMVRFLKEIELKERQ